MKKAMKIDDDFIPCLAVTGDELFPNGIFVFNITKMIEYIQKNSDDIVLEEVALGDFTRDFSSINESHVDSVDISEPVIIAEISPERYNLIDGNHRMEKARRLGINSIRAYKLDAEQHVKFLITRKAYETFTTKIRQYRDSVIVFLDPDTGIAPGNYDYKHVTHGKSGKPGR